MICTVACYRWLEGAHFNHDYYNSEHMRIANALIAPHGLRKLESCKLISLGEPKPGDVIAQTHAYFDSLAVALKAVKQTGAQLMADVPNYTNIRPESYVYELKQHV